MKNDPFLGRPGDEPDNDVGPLLTWWSWLRGCVLFVLLFLLAHVLGAATLHVVNGTELPVTVVNVSNAGTAQPSFAVPAMSEARRTFVHVGWGSSWQVFTRTEYSQYAVADTVNVTSGDGYYVANIVQETDGSGGLKAIADASGTQLVVVKYSTDPSRSWDGAIPSTVEVPGLGEVELPSWAATNPHLAVFFFGLACAAGVALVRAGLRWFKRADGVPVE